MQDAENNHLVIARSVEIDEGDVAIPVPVKSGIFNTEIA